MQQTIDKRMVKRIPWFAQIWGFAAAPLGPCPEECNYYQSRTAVVMENQLLRERLDGLARKTSSGLSNFWELK
jgi:hypothetical protein